MKKTQPFATLFLLLTPLAAQSKTFFQTGQPADFMLSGVGFNQTGAPCASTTQTVWLPPART